MSMETPATPRAIERELESFATWSADPEYLSAIDLWELLTEVYILPANISSRFLDTNEGEAILSTMSQTDVIPAINIGDGRGNWYSRSLCIAIMKHYDVQFPESYPSWLKSRGGTARLRASAHGDDDREEETAFRNSVLSSLKALEERQIAMAKRESSRHSQHTERTERIASSLVELSSQICHLSDSVERVMLM